MQRPQKTQGPPNDYALENVMIYCLITHPRQLKVLNIKPEYFHNEIHRTAYEILVKMRDDNESINLVTFASRFYDKGGKMSELMIDFGKYDEQFHSELSMETYLKLLANEYAKRFIREKYEGFKTVPQEFIEEVKSVELEFVTQKNPTFEESLNEYDIDWEVRRKKREEKGSVGLVTGFKFIDEKAVIEPGYLTVIAAGPSIGKSSFSLCLAHGAAYYDQNTLFFSGEMGSNRLLDRLFSIVTDRPAKGFKDSSDQEGLAEAKKELLNIKDHFKIIELVSGTTSDVVAISTKESMRKPIDLIVVDYLQYLSDETKKGETRAQTVGKMALRLKTLAKELNAAVLVLSQFSREGTKNPKEIPKLYQLKESGDIENHADSVFILHRTSRESKKAILQIAKNREGEAMIMKYFDFDPVTTKFTESSSKTEKQQQDFSELDFWT
jgi:replicative DNA helicase